MRLSTIVPAFNRADLIGATLDSLLAQSRPPDEIIVVDDGSNDGTAEVVEAFGGIVRFVRQANAGAGAARNRGFAESSGDVIHFMDSDDLSSPNSYEVQLRALADDAGMTYGPWLKTKFAGKVLEPEGVVLQQRPVPAGVTLDRLILRGSWVTVFQPCLFRRSVIESAGPYRTDLKPSEDTEMLYRVCRAIKRAVHTPETLVLYRVHPENQISLKMPEKRRIDWARLWKQLEAHADGRDDLDRATRSLVRFEKKQAALDVYPHDRALAEMLVPGLSGRAGTMHEARRFSRRVIAKIRRIGSLNIYGDAYQAAPITPIQRQQIELMKYTIA